jgi:eukaryotic-like serine/threonine-protein kinase
MLPSAMQPLAPGLLVTPNVRLDRPLGEGGMGSVWLADHLSLHSKVVVKFISDALATSEEARTRFAREAAAASQVKSPHVVQTFDHGVMSDGTPYIVMEHLEGRSLGDTLTECGAMEAALVIDIVAQLSRALDKAHASGIVHRDIKPDNVFLCDAGTGEVFVKLLDFGIAKGQSAAISGETKTGSVMGSPLYMSPEQLMGAKDLDFHSDLWSVGVLVFEALSGVRPFEADTVGALTMRIHNQAHPKPSSVMEGATSELDSWFEKACNVQPNLRFESAKKLADALSVALIGSSLVMRSRAPLPSGPVPMSRTVDPSGSQTLRQSQSGERAPDADAKAKKRTLFIGVAVALLALVSVPMFLLRPLKTTSTSIAPEAKPAVPAATADLSLAPPPTVSGMPFATASAALSSAAPKVGVRLNNGLPPKVTPVATATATTKTNAKSTSDPIE